MPWLRNPEVNIGAISGAAGACLESQLDKCDYFIEMYNPGQSHWFVVFVHRSGAALVVDSIQKELQHYRGAVEICRDALQKIMHLDLDKDAPTMVWKHWYQQNDGYNCGLFSCLAVMFVIRHIRLFTRLMNGEDVALPPMPHQMLPLLRENFFVFFKLVYPLLNSRNQNWAVSNVFDF
jgi:hypothetical protein